MRYRRRMGLCIAGIAEIYRLILVTMMTVNGSTDTDTQ